MMLPSATCSASKHNSLHSSFFTLSLNTPEEDDETMSSKADPRDPRDPRDPSPDPRDPSPDPRDHPDHPGPSDHLSSSHIDSVYSGHRGHSNQQHSAPQEVPCGYLPYQPPQGLPAGYSQPTPFPSRAQEEEEEDDEDEEGGRPSSWLHPSLASGWTPGGAGGFLPSSLPSYPSLKDPSPLSYSSSCSSYSLPGRYSPVAGSLEQPRSLHSNPPAPASASANLPHHHTLSPYYCSPPGAACCAQCPADAFTRGPPARPGYHPSYAHYYADGQRPPPAAYGVSSHYSSSKQKNPAYNSPLSLEQRRVFVTYEADNDKHVNEIINFVALLRHNGFDTHIDMFEQHFRSISKIDFMERYLTEKEYLIIIIISPKYHQTVTAPPFSLESDERTLNTVYIHKQLQNEFIQNGSKNFRFIPIVFPGGRKRHVPTWLQNTQVYGWPRDRDDILRRLMRVEKYNPPPIGQLPTIIPIPI